MGTNRDKCSLSSTWNRSQMKKRRREANRGDDKKLRCNDDKKNASNAVCDLRGETTTTTFTFLEVSKLLF